MVNKPDLIQKIKFADLAGKFGVKVKETRTAKKITRDFLGDLVGVTGDTIENIEGGKNAGFETACKIAYVLDISLDSVVEDTCKNISKESLQELLVLNVRYLNRITH